MCEKTWNKMSLCSKLSVYGAGGGGSGGSGGGGFFLAYDDFGRMFDHWLPACAFLLLFVLFFIWSGE